MALSESTWRIVDLIVKGLIGTVISGLITIYGTQLQKTQAAMTEALKQSQAVIEITSKQKELDLNLGMRMFEALMNHYFEKGEIIGNTKQAQKLILLLRLMALNFQDVPINLKPLFEAVSSQLTNSKSKEQLREIAKEVARRQAFRVTSQTGFDSGPIRCKTGEEKPFKDLGIRVKVENITEDHVKVSLILGGPEKQTVGPFSISYFDMPILDNIKLGDFRVSLILLDSDGKTADIRLVGFPADLAADRFDVKELARVLKQTRHD